MNFDLTWVIRTRYSISPHIKTNKEKGQRMTRQAVVRRVTPQVAQEPKIDYVSVIKDLNEHVPFQDEAGNLFQLQTHDDARGILPESELIGQIKMVVECDAVTEIDEENLSVNTLKTLEVFGYKMKTIKKEIPNVNTVTNGPAVASPVRVTPEEVKAPVQVAPEVQKQEVIAPAASIPAATNERRRKPRATKAEMEARKAAKQSEVKHIEVAGAKADLQLSAEATPEIVKVIHTPVASNRIKNIYDFIAVAVELPVSTDLDALATNIITDMIKEGYETVPVFQLCRALEVAFKK